MTNNNSSDSHPRGCRCDDCLPATAADFKDLQSLLRQAKDSVHSKPRTETEIIRGMISACDAYFEKFPSKREKTKATDSVRRPVRSDYSSDHAYQTAQRGFDEVSRALRGEAPRQALQADFPMPPTGMRPRHNVVVAFNEAIKSAGERMRNMYAR